MALTFKTLLLLTSGYPIKGVSEPYLMEEIKYLSKSFQKIIVVPITESKTKDLIETPANVECYFPLVEQNTLISQTLLLRILISDLSNIIKLPGLLSQLRYYRSYLLNKLQIAHSINKKLVKDGLLSDNSLLIYSYWFSEPALVGAILKSHHPLLKLISRGHGYDIFEEQSSNNYLPFKYFKLKAMDTLFSVSQRGYRYLSNQFPDLKSKIDCSYIGTQDNDLAPFDSSSDFTIVTCSMVRGIKRLHLMPEILKEIKFNITWHVLGDGSELSKIKIACENLPANVNIKFHGYLEPDEIVNFYKRQSVNLFMSLSSSEGLPVSMMEAISFGIPLMSTDVGGCNEICNSNTGILIEKDFKSKDVADAISAFKNSKMNDVNFRRSVREYWGKQFSSDRNYKAFTETIST